MKAVHLLAVIFYPTEKRPRLLLARSGGFGAEEGWEYFPLFAGYFVGSPLMVIGATLGIISAFKSRSKK